MPLRPEEVLNPGLENWSSPTDADDWGEPALDGGTINRDGVDQFAGTFCCRITKTSAAQVRFEQGFTNIFIPGKWYRIEYQTKTDGVPAVAISVRIVNDTDATLKYWNVANQAWEIGATDLPAEIGTTYARDTTWIRIDPTHSQSDQFRLFFRNDSEATGDFFMDDVSIRGPYDVPVVNITGTIIDPNGDPLERDGVLVARLNGVGHVLDGAGNNLMLPPVIKQFPIDNGVVDMDLVPVSYITLENGGAPRWIINYNIPQFEKLSEIWNLGDESPVDLVAVPKE